MVNVLADRHHAGLFHSLQLMSRRFEWTLYTPTGHEWWDAGIWRFGEVYGDDRLAQQYLMHADPVDSEFPDWPIQFVTLAEAEQMPWAYVIASVQENQPGFTGFASRHRAKMVMQVGNTGQYTDWHLNPLALVSSEMPIEGRGIRYHQEMDPIEFRPPPEKDGWQETAASFVNCMPSMGACYQLMQQAQADGLVIGEYGIDGRDGVIKPNTALLDIMEAVGWGWHDKQQGDGFGHVIHSWAAVGRPLIGHASHYKGKMAERFWHDGITCIDLDRHSVAEAVRIVQATGPAKHAAMCRAIRTLFEDIDYDAEAAQIGDFLEVQVPA